ncbi:MAG TPA: hypothetical protein VK002_15775 [Rubricoccaceae bacterium]|nr:hypothetical protein [Rubricoccaceae bacterium]
MPLLRRRPRARRRANLQIDYPFDHVAYARWRLRCWGAARLRRGGAALSHAAAAAGAALGVGRRRAGS